MTQRGNVPDELHRVLTAGSLCCSAASLHCLKATVTITRRGVITLPARLREAMGLQVEDHLIAETAPQGLLLRPAVTLRVEQYTPGRERKPDEAAAAGRLAER